MVLLELLKLFTPQELLFENIEELVKSQKYYVWLTLHTILSSSFVE